MTPFQERLGRFTVQCMTGINNVVYRLSAGRVAGRVPSGAPVCLLTTIGRRTGRRRTVALLYVELDGELVVVASRGGMSTHPAWYLNLLAEPEVTVATGAVSRRARARPASAEEVARAWPVLTAAYRHFDEYQQRTDREIPVVVISPLEG
jgi:deazaflavin-dependent oxidoreductase (nitroreductase family)